MLNYIIPPIIIVISLSILIVFLFHKAQKISVQEIVTEENNFRQRKKMATIASAAGQFWLKVLEKIMQKMKLSALKFHNVSNDWVHSIREKRQQRALSHRENSNKEESDESVGEKEKNSQRIKEKYASFETEKQQARPLVRESITRPQRMGIREKNQLEEILIKRIAINPRDIEAYERLGDYYLESENYADSHECFSQVLKLSPSHRKARLRIRRLEMLMNK